VGVRVDYLWMVLLSKLCHNWCLYGVRYDELI
jgi:hypothetical protein